MFKIMILGMLLLLVIPSVLAGDKYDLYVLNLPKEIPFTLFGFSSLDLEHDKNPDENAKGLLSLVGVFFNIEYTPHLASITGMRTLPLIIMISTIFLAVYIRRRIRKLNKDVDNNISNVALSWVKLLKKSKKGESK